MIIIRSFISGDILK